LTDVIATLHADGHRLILTEGGPSVVSALTSEGLLDELFVTSSPFLFGRFPADGRKALTDGVDLGRVELELSSARRHESHLFLRYAVR
jgi:riboflavin biosynthesis pyrimidine reductase